MNMHMSFEELVENTTILTTTAIPSGGENYPIWVGYIAVLVAMVFFGSNFVPAAKYPIGDGVSFQFFLCCGIWVTGIIINLSIGNPPFFPLVIVGGVLWTTGNVLSVFVIPINGLGLSMLLWSTSNLFMGWASGHFGWFGLIPEGVEKPALNYIGVTIAILSGLIFLTIRTGKIQEIDPESRPIIDSNNTAVINTSVEGVSKADDVLPPSEVSLNMRIIACILALISGIFFGLVFTPSTYIQDHRDKYPGAKKNGLNYIFSMYTGILLASFVYYTIYILAKRNRPHIDAQSIFPAFVSGIMWGIAQAGFILANSVLSQAISFPLISIGPATIAALWSILYIKDIVGRRNYLIFVGGTFLRVIAAIFIILSKPKA